ncbi:MAG: L,D-transpeptidase family protein [Betaproteobacteria bacterium]
MARIRRNIFFLARLLGSLLLLSCLSPAPDATAPKADTFPSLPASFAGQLRIVIWKSQYTLTLYKGDQPVKTYRAVFGKGYQDGDKRTEGDKRTPEGDFYICTMNHSKRFYKFLGLSYPGLKHAEYGLQSRIISTLEYEMIKKAIDEQQQPPWGTRLGGAVGIHGRILEGAVPNKSPVTMNWTDGCIALDNADVDEIYSVVTLGTPVTILP